MARHGSGADDTAAQEEILTAPITAPITQALTTSIAQELEAEFSAGVT